MQSRYLRVNKTCALPTSPSSAVRSIRGFEKVSIGSIQKETSSCKIFTVFWTWFDLPCPLAGYSCKHCGGLPQRQEA